MRPTNRILASCLLSLAVVATGSACTSTRRGIQRLASSHLADTATSYNLAIEQTQDEMLLLNVIRAQDNYPLYITTASKVTGTVKADISLGLKIPLLHAGSASGNDYFATPSIDYSSSPSMDVNLLNTKDFMTGFLAPITPDQFAYYWDQGWCSEFLLYLLVLRVDMFESGKPHPPHPVDSFYNQPDILELTKFSGWVNDLVKGGRPRLCKDDADDAAVGPPLDADRLDALKFLVPVAKEGLSLTRSPAGDSATFTPAKKPAGDSTTPTLAGKEVKWQLSKPKSTYSLVGQGQQCPERLKGSRSDVKAYTDATETAKGHEYVLTLRSPEGILYYLGQLARMENPRDEKDQKLALLIHYCGEYKSNDKNYPSPPPLEPLFVALDKRKHGPCESIIWVRALDGADYMIPRGGKNPPALNENDLPKLADASQLCSTGQTMHALSLVSQLISLQMSAKDFTTTSTVKLVGQ